MMEAELFVHPKEKSWPGFKKVRHEKLSLVPNEGAPRTMALEEAVKSKVIVNEALAYFIWLTHKFAVDIGMDPKRLRFRQHKKTEMAHYAADCWDLEAEIGYGWVEMVGIADRGSYDLQAHIDHSGADLTAFERFDEPKEVEQEVVKPNFGALGPQYKGKAKQVAEALSKMSPSAAKGKSEVLVDVGGEKLRVPASCFKVILKREKVAGRKLVPHVIEPSYGVDRILYAVLDHSYSKKDDYVTLRLKGLVAPIKVGIFPLMAKDGLDEIASGISDAVSKAGFAAYYDDSGSIGRRYARMDEVGTPCCVTVDYESKTDGTVTMRERDSTKQIRIKQELVPKAIEALISGAGLESLSKLK